MRFKLDENLGDLGRAILEAHGHDVMTVVQQGLSGSADTQVYRVCQYEERVLVTLDRDFGQTLRFPPEQTAGIVVLELRGRLSPASIAKRIEALAAALEAEPIERELWIVEAGRIRVHQRRQ